MRMTHGKLLRELDALHGQENLTLGGVATAMGVEIDRVMDGLDTLKILRYYGIDVREATEVTTIFADEEA